MEHQQAIQNLAVESYLLDQMTPQERDAFEEHYFECSVCAEDVRTASRFLEDAREILSEGPALRQVKTDSIPGRVVPDSEKRFWSWFGWLKPQFAAPALAVLVVLVALQAFRIIPSLRNQVDEAGAASVVPSVFLRPGTRGDVPLILVKPQSPLLLSLDLPGSPAAATPLQFVIETADGKEEMRVGGEAPEPGQPLNLMISRVDLPSGLYTLIAEYDTTSARFPFRLERQ